MNQCFPVVHRSFPYFHSAFLFHHCLQAASKLTVQEPAGGDVSCSHVPALEKEWVWEPISVFGSVSSRQCWLWSVYGRDTGRRESACGGRAGRKELTGQDGPGENVEETGRRRRRGHANILKHCQSRRRWVGRLEEAKEYCETGS